jgi:hypothetical protein
MSNLKQCKRCSYVWLPCGVRELPCNGNTYMTDLGICTKCRHAVSRVNVATPGDVVAAYMWGEGKFEVKKVEE